MSYVIVSLSLRLCLSACYIELTNGAFSQELSRRCDTLIRLVEKENEEMEAAEKEERKKTTKKTDSKPSETSGGATKKRKASSGSGAPTKKRSIAA